jgi:hypothetical protein
VTLDELERLSFDRRLGFTVAHEDELGGSRRKAELDLAVGGGLRHGGGA